MYTPDGHEQIAGLHLTAIEANGCDLHRIRISARDLLHFEAL
jgi:hypothetical protein